MVEGWQRKSLSDLVEFRNGMNFTRASSGETIKVVGVGDFKSNEVLAEFKNSTAITINGSVNEADLLKDNDLLFVRSNGNKALVGRCVLLSNISEPITFSGFTIRARVNSSSVDHSYLSKLVRSPLFKAHLHRFGAGSSINNLSQEVLSEFAFNLPPLPEQRRIAEILRTWDEALHALTALRNAKAQRLLSLTHSLVFGQRQLGGFNIAGEPTAYRWFALPASWGCEPIGKLATEVSERNGGCKQLEVLSCSKYDGFVRSLEYFKKQVYSSDLSGYKKIWRDDFGFPSNHVEEGSIGLQNLTDVGLVSPIYTIFRFDPERVDPDFAFAVLKTSLYRHIFNVSTSASVDRRGSLRWGEFSKIPFPLPPLAEQKAIAAALTTAKQELTLIDRQIDALSRQKCGLMQKLLTGEWRVKVEEPETSSQTKETTHGR